MHEYYWDDAAAEKARAAAETRRWLVRRSMEVGPHLLTEEPAILWPAAIYNEWARGWCRSHGYRWDDDRRAWLLTVAALDAAAVQERLAAAKEAYKVAWPQWTGDEPEAKASKEN